MLGIVQMNACNYLDGDVVGTNSEIVKFAQTAFSGNGTHGHIGNFYNWTAGIAMNDSSEITGQTYTDPSGNPGTSICPKGWRLPISNQNYSDDEFMTLSAAYGIGNTEEDQRDSVLKSAPFYAVRAGGFAWGGYLQQAGNVGGLMSSTLLGVQLDWEVEHVGTFDFASYAAGTNYGSARFDAVSIRCIAR